MVHLFFSYLLTIQISAYLLNWMQSHLEARLVRENAHEDVLIGGTGITIAQNSCYTE